MRDFEPDDPAPPFLQLAAVIREAIDDGELQPGDRLPSGADLQARYGLASMTVRSAIRELRGEGLLVSRQGSGVFVRTTPSPPPGGDRAAEVRRILERLYQLRTRIDVLTAMLTEHAPGDPQHQHAAALLSAGEEEQRELVTALTSLGA